MTKQSGLKKILNWKGKLMEITLQNVNSGSNRILVPIGEDRKGWETYIFPFCLWFLKARSKRRGKRQSPTQKANHSTSYVAAIKKETCHICAPSPEFVDSSTTPKAPSLTSINKSIHAYPHSSIHFNSSVIIKRCCFHDDWCNMIRAFNIHMSSACIINPFSIDKAVLCCEDIDQAKTLRSRIGIR